MNQLLINKKNAWIHATRPKTLPASAGPVILGLALANSAFDPMIALVTLSCALLLQVGSNLVNDYYDHQKGIDSEKRLGPIRASSAGLLSPNEVQKGFLLCFGVAFGLGAILMAHGGLPIVVIGLFSILFAFIYTGGPFPLSYYGLGEIAALIFFGPVAVWGTSYLQNPDIGVGPALYGLVPGFAAAAIMAINNLRDRISDRQSGKFTLAVLLGESAGRWLVLALIFLSALTPLLLALVNGKYLACLSAMTAVVFASNWREVLKAPIDQRFNDVLAMTGKYLFVTCLLLAVLLSL